MFKKKVVNQTQFVIPPELEEKCRKAQELHLKMQSAKEVSKKNILDVLIEGRTMLEIEAAVPWGSFEDVCVEKMPDVPLRNVRYYAGKARKMFGAARGEPFTLRDCRNHEILFTLWSDKTLTDLCKPGLKWKDVAETIAAEKGYPGYGAQHFGKATPTVNARWKNTKDPFGDLPPAELQTMGDLIVADMLSKGYIAPSTQGEQLTIESLWEQTKTLLAQLPPDQHQSKGPALVAELMSMGFAPAAAPVDQPTIEGLWESLKGLIGTLPPDQLQAKGLAVLSDLITLGFAPQATPRKKGSQPLGEQKNLL